MNSNLNTATQRTQLHEYIERADQEHIAAMYVLLEKELQPIQRYDKATLDMLYRRVEKDQQGNSRSYTVQEAMDAVRAHKARK